MIKELARDNKFIINIIDKSNIDEEDEKNKKEKKDNNIAIIYNKNNNY